MGVESPQDPFKREVLDPKKISIERFEENPLLKPGSRDSWMGENVFNPAVIKKDGVDEWVMLFRGASTPDQSMSSLGLALSEDGINWSIKPEPVLACGVNEHCELGIRDPRIVKWEDGSYYIFVTGNGRAGTRVVIFKTDDFSNYEFVGVPFDEDDANAAVFPESINGQAYLLHRFPPNIRLARTSDPTLKGDWVDDQVLIKAAEFYSHPDHTVGPTKIGIAGPPIRTPKGWLVITHVVHNYAPKITPYSFLIYRSYSLSFMVLDIVDPTKVLYVHDKPILWPEERCEIVGAVPNVVFSCSLVDPGGSDLIIHWGAADTRICGGKLSKESLTMCY